MTPEEEIVELEKSFAEGKISRKAFQRKHRSVQRRKKNSKSQKIRLEIVAILTPILLCFFLWPRARKNTKAIAKKREISKKAKKVYTLKKIKKQNVLLEDIAQIPVKKISRVFNSYYQKSPRILNDLLRFLHKTLQNPNMKESPDIHNLIGRLYWYKIHLDQKRKFYSLEWRKKWAREAKKAWEKAKIYYQKHGCSSIRYRIQKWMPENRSNKKSEIFYQNKKQAIDDMNLLLAKISEIEQTMTPYRDYEDRPNR